MNATLPSASLNGISSGRHGRENIDALGKYPVEIATIAIVGAAVLGRLVLGRIVNRMLREVAGDVLKR
jgi:hypothetical protein